MIEAFQANEIDVGIGLTEAWLAGYLKHAAAQPQQNSERQINLPYHITSPYTLSQLRWALSTGPHRDDINNAEDLKGKKVGISRFGSGSHIMACVLAHNNGWVDEASFKFIEVGPFASLREAVNSGDADFFMWEHFTTKKYFDDGTLKRLGETVTPWPGWHIATRGPSSDERVTEKLLPDLRKGIHYFGAHKDESVDLICSIMEYSRADAEQWYEEVKFPYQSLYLNETVIRKALKTLVDAGFPGGENEKWLRAFSLRAKDVLYENKHFHKVFYSGKSKSESPLEGVGASK